MTIFKRKLYFTAFAAALAAIILTMATTCFAADNDYQFDVDTGTITKYQGSDTNVTIPTTIAGYPVTKIGAIAFTGCNTVVSVTINSNIESIGSGAFKGLKSLKTLTINTDTLTIANGVFSGAGLENINISCTNKISFGEQAFADCHSLTTVNLPNGLEELPTALFWNSQNLETVILPNSLQTIGTNAFSSCIALKNIVIPDSVTNFGTGVFQYCYSLETISIPDSVTGSITRDMFVECRNLHNIEIGSRVSAIDSDAFKGSAVEELTLPLSVKTLHGFSLENANSLSKLTIMNDNINIEYADELKRLPKSCVIYCGANSNALKPAIGAGLKYVIIDTPSAAEIDTDSQQTDTVSGTPVAETTAVLSSQSLSVDGSSVSVEAYNIGGNNYFKLRDVAYILNGTEKQFGISYNNSTNSISLISGTAYQAVGSELQKTGVAEIYASPSIAAITLDGSAVTAQAYNINGSNYFKLRDLASLIDFGIDYNQSTGTINIITSEGYSES